MSWGTICLDFLDSDTSPQLSADLLINAGINASESLAGGGFSYSGITITNTLNDTVSQGILISKAPGGWVKSNLPVADLAYARPGHGIALESGTMGQVIKILLFGTFQNPALVLVDDNQYASNTGFTDDPPYFIQFVGKSLDIDTLLFDPDWAYLSIPSPSGGAT